MEVAVTGRWEAGKPDSDFLSAQRNPSRYVHMIKEVCWNKHSVVKPVVKPLRQPSFCPSSLNANSHVGSSVLVPVRDTPRARKTELLVDVELATERIDGGTNGDTQDNT